MRKFRQVEDGVERYWHVRQDGVSVHLVWGVVGGRVSRLVKELPTEGKARAEVKRLVRQREARGYEPVPEPDPEATD